MNLSQNQIKLIRSLGQKKFRQKYQYFVAEGSKISLAVLQSAYEIVNVYAISDWLDMHEAKLHQYQDQIIKVSPKQLKQISYLKTPNQVLLLLRIRQEPVNTVDTSQGLHFYLDEIQNPGNLGTIIRIADWFGFDSVIASENCVDFYNEKTIQATMGAFTNIKLVKSELDMLPQLADSNIVTSSLAGESVYSVPLPTDAVIVIGNEGSGISEGILKKSTLNISIPAAPTSTGDSLNAAVSAGVLASLFARSSTDI